jgi:cystathionine beta-lyase
LLLTPLEATYLGWIDVRGTGLNRPAEFFEQAGVGLHDGPVFKGPGFLRMNFGCPRALLEQALDRMQQALQNQNQNHNQHQDSMRAS